MNTTLFRSDYEDIVSYLTSNTLPDQVSQNKFEKNKALAKWKKKMEKYKLENNTLYMLDKGTPCLNALC